ncbi:T9SS sorting signal type C domain-containing protein, partial [uncultured Flavobacterium sp.]
SNRFEIVYESTLSVTTPDLTNQIIVFVKDAMLNVQTSSAILSGIQVFDVQGRIVLDLKNINAATFITSLSQISNGVLVVKVITEDGIITTKKIIN